MSKKTAKFYRFLSTGCVDKFLIRSKFLFLHIELPRRNALRMFHLILSEQNKRRKIISKRKKRKLQENQDASTVKLTENVEEKKDDRLDAGMREG